MQCNGKKSPPIDQQINCLIQRNKQLTITCNGEEQNRDVFSDEEFTIAISAGGNVMISLPISHKGRKGGGTDTN